MRGHTCMLTGTLECGEPVLHQSGLREKCFVIRFFSYCLWLIACIPDHIRFKVISVYKGAAGVLLLN